MLDEFTRMSKEEAVKLLNPDTLSAISRSRASSGIESLLIDGVQATVSKKLGSGGSKEVYDISVRDQHYAIALTGTVDHTQIVIEKWTKVLQEPTNTDRLRNLGFYVNDLCQLVPTSVNGYEFPGLIMRRYADHDFPIYDSKNPKGRYHELIKAEEQVTDETALELFAPISDEIAKLIRAGASLGRDSINLCDINGVPHLYLNDLGAASFGEISPDDFEGYAEHYVSSAIGAFVNTVIERVYRGNSYVHSMADLGSSLQPKLVQRVMATLKESSPSSHS
jgi:hypothetical protein